MELPEMEISSFPFWEEKCLYIGFLLPSLREYGRAQEPALPYRKAKPRGFSVLW